MRIVAITAFRFPFIILLLLLPLASSFPPIPQARRTRRTISTGTTSTTVATAVTPQLCTTRISTVNTCCTTTTRTTRWRTSPPPPTARTSKMPSRADVFSSACTSSSSLFAESVSTRSSTSTKGELLLLEKVTIVGFGSLLSERSAKSTFPHLQNFRLGKVNDYQRVFGHPASIFFERGIANNKTKEMSSLAAEYCPGSSFICSVFEVSNENGEFMVLDTDTDTASSTRSNGDDNDDDLNSGSASPVPSMAFREREEEFEILMVPYEEIENCENPNVTFDDASHSGKTVGILCTRSTDENYIKLWGQQRFDEKYKKYNIDTIWNWSKDSKLRPCGPYFRHCVLAAKSMGKECYNSFLDDTVLVDRLTTVRQYLEEYPQVMETLPPPSLADRYGG